MESKKDLLKAIEDLRAEFLGYVNDLKSDIDFMIGEVQSSDNLDFIKEMHDIIKAITREQGHVDSGWYMNNPDAEDGEKVEKRYNEELERMAAQEITQYNEDFERIAPMLDEYKYNPQGPDADEKKRRFIKYFYMVGLVYPEWGACEDELAHRRALKYAERIPVKQKQL